MERQLRENFAHEPMDVGYGFPSKKTVDDAKNSAMKMAQRALRLIQGAAQEFMNFKAQLISIQARLQNLIITENEVNRLTLEVKKLRTEVDVLKNQRR